MSTEERNVRSADIDQRSTLEILQIINDEDATVAGVVRQALPAVAQAVDAVTERIRQGGRLIYVGAGTSGRLGVLDAAECVPTFGTPPDLVQALIAGGPAAFITPVEGAEDDELAGESDLRALNLTQHDAVVGIAASGRTPYVLGALRYANKIGSVAIAISCNSPALILDAAQIGIAAVVGPEVLTGSTRMKAGTAQKLILNMISTATMIRLGKVYSNLMVDVRITNQKLANRARRMVCEITGISTDEAANLLAQSENEVKTAIVMALRQVDADQARALLEASGGMLRQVILNSHQQ